MPLALGDHLDECRAKTERVHVFKDLCVFKRAAHSVKVPLQQRSTPSPHGSSSSCTAVSEAVFSTMSTDRVAAQSTDLACEFSPSSSEGLRQDTRTSNNESCENQSNSNMAERKVAKGGGQVSCHGLGGHAP